jgi:transposase-like protein
LDSIKQYSFDAHYKRFGTNEKCHDYLASIKWNGRPECIRCGNDNKNYYLPSRNLYKCSKCKKQFSVIQGTIFEGSKIPLTKWFLAIYIFTTKKRGVSSYQMAKWVGIKQQSAWFLLHRLREALKEENDIILQGIVESDETFVGPDISKNTRLQREQKEHYEKQEALHGVEKGKARKRRGFAIKRGRKKGDTKEVRAQNKREKEAKGKRVPFDKYTMVLGLTERNGGKIVLKKLGHGRPSVNAQNVHPHLRKHISAESIFITDQATVYNFAKNFFSEHQVVNHEETYVTKDGVHTNSIEGVWTHFKKMIDCTYFHLSQYHFDRYLNEYTYRWNRRNESEQSIFDSFMPLTTGKRIKYESLIVRENKMVA